MGIKMMNFSAAQPPFLYSNCDPDFPDLADLLPPLPLTLPAHVHGLRSPRRQPPLLPPLDLLRLLWPPPASILFASAARGQPPPVSVPVKHGALPSSPFVSSAPVINVDEGHPSPKYFGDPGFSHFGLHHWPGVHSACRPQRRPLWLKTGSS